MNHTVVVLVGSVHRGVLEALAYARSLHPDRLLAVTVVSDEEEQERIERTWCERSTSTSRSRSCTRRTGSSPAPVMRFVDELDARYENSIDHGRLPEFVVGSWWGQLLHNQSALLLKGRLLFRKGTVVTSVPYHLEDVIDSVRRTGEPPDFLGDRNLTSRPSKRSLRVCRKAIERP